MGMSDFRSTSARASFEPHHGELRQAGTSFGSQTETAGRRFVSQPIGSLDTTSEPQRLAGVSGISPSRSLLSLL